MTSLLFTELVMRLCISNVLSGLLLRRSSSGLLMALGKILLGRWTADIYLEDCLKIRSTGVDNEDCA